MESADGREPMRVCWCSDWSERPVQTGFSRASLGILRYLHGRGHEIIEVGVGYQGEHRNAPWPIVGTTVFGGRLEGQDTAPLVALREKSDVLVLFMDVPDAAWGVTYLDKTNRPLGELSIEVLDKRPFALCMYSPIDSNWACGKPPKDWEVFRRKPFDGFAAPSRFGVEMLSKVVETPVVRLPHGVDFKMFFPMDRMEARKALGLPSDAFVLLYNAVNKHRKQVPAFFETGSKLLGLVPELAGKLILVFNGTKREDYYDIQAVVDGYDLEGRGISVFNHDSGLSDEAIRILYNAADAYVHLSGGEGFGLPIVEAQACRIPAFVTDYSAMGELVPDAERGFLRIPPKALIPHPRNALCWAWPDTDVAAERLAEFYRDKSLRVRLRKACFENSRAYSWDRIGPVAETWLRDAIAYKHRASDVVRVEEA